MTASGSLLPDLASSNLHRQAIDYSGAVEVDHGVTVLKLPV